MAGMESVPIGVTKPQRARLDPSAPVGSFTWKPLKPGYVKGYMESYKAEIAAYELDKMLGLEMVPPVVERSIDGEKGAALYWIENTTGWDIKNPPKRPNPAWSRRARPDEDVRPARREHRSQPGQPPDF